jgi:hypothetical protein
MDVLAKFSKRVQVGDGCWKWLGSHFSVVPRGGYARFCPSHGRSLYAHRFMYELMRGPIPQGFFIDHLCRNRWCINPEHLEAVTSRENILRGEGRAAINSQKKFCPQGHELAGSNLAQYQLRAGHRACRICANARLRAKAKRSN